MSPIDRACEVTGSQKALADLLSVKPSTVSQWRNGIRPVPIERCSDIERATERAVTRRDLRPNDWHHIWPELIDADHPAPVDTTKAILEAVKK